MKEGGPTGTDGGRRRILSISEVTGMEGDAFCLQEIFRFRQTGLDANGNALGQFEAGGVRPQILDRILSEGVALPPDLFRQRVLPPPRVA